MSKALTAHDNPFLRLRVAPLSYDGVGRLTGTRDTNYAAAELDRAILVYDPVGNPILKVTADGAHTMTYDAANQLLSEDHPLAGIKTWSYDPAGNRLSQDFTQVGVRTHTSWTYDPADQLLVQDASGQLTTFLFDQAGNQQEESGPSGRTTYTWNQENRLVEVAQPDGSRSTMSYRADGLRYQLWEDGQDLRMAWDSQGTSGYQDLLEENQP